MDRTKSCPHDQRSDGDPATRELLEDWITIWQSEFAALVYDREAQDTLSRMVEGWASQSRAGLAFFAPSMQVHGFDPSDGHTGPDAPAGPAAAPAAPHGSSTLAELVRARIARLDR